MIEKDIEKKLKRRLNEMGCECLKFVSPGCSGVPDRIVLIPGGTAIFVETKAPGKRERPRQTYVQDSLRKMGFTVFSTVDSDRLIDLVAAYCEGVMETQRSIKAMKGIETDAV